jgi:tryptophan 2,3-dioxygenase
MSKKIPPVRYHDYLKLDEILAPHHLRSREFGKEAHDENLFITVHQAYEVWFKQILIEIDSILEIFKTGKVAERQMALVTDRLKRVNDIFRLIVQQIPIIETMTPLDFLDFREYLYPASGFQSVQFRLIENKLGLKKEHRLAYNKESYEKALRDDHQNHAVDSEKQSNLFELVDQWLARTPFLKLEKFEFWNIYREAVEKMFAEDREIVEHNEFLDDDGKKRNLEQISQAWLLFKDLFSEAEFKKRKAWRLSYEAVHAALFIQLYRDQPVFQTPFRLLTELIDLDENLSNWRYQHALMAQRMLGTKIGTGGSSGSQYLKAATEQHRIFTDFTQLTTFFIPRSRLPKLPPQVEQKLGFIYET